MQNKGFEAAKKNVWDHEKCASVSGEFCKIIFMIRNNLVVGNEMLVTWKCNISANNLSCELPVHPQISQHLLSDTLHNAAATRGWKPCFHFADEDLFLRVWKTVLPAPFCIFSIQKDNPSSCLQGWRSEEFISGAWWDITCRQRGEQLNQKGSNPQNRTQQHHQTNPAISLLFLWCDSLSEILIKTQCRFLKAANVLL